MTADRARSTRHPPSASQLARAAALIAVLCALVIAVAPPAHAATSGRHITRYDATVDLSADGTMRVLLDFDFDFGDDPGHGPYITLPTEVKYDEEFDRVYEYTDVHASSDDPQAAPADVNLSEENGWIEVKVGDESKDDVSGRHRYKISYIARGLVNSADATNAGDELYWNAIGDGWTIPLSDVSITVVGPAPVQKVACFAGSVGATGSCDGAVSDGLRAGFVQGSLEPGEALTVDAGYPPGTFTDAAPILHERWELGKAFTVNPWTGSATVLVLLVGIGLVLSRARQRGRDEQYLDQVPGLAPLGDQPGGVGPRPRRTPIAVHFTPPAGFRAGQLGTLLDERADPRDVTATIVDLAVRGYLRIEQAEEANFLGRGADWRMIALRDADSALAPYERTLLNAIFVGRSEVTLSDLKTTFASSMTLVQGQLYDDVTQRGWFRGNPKSVRAHWYVAGGLLTLAGAGLTVLLAAFTHWGLVGLALLPAGVVLLAVARTAPARTADGTAVLAQTLGFRQYLATAEAEQLRFEEGEDLFSRYLPFAIVFGLTERWSGIFERLAAQGHQVPEPTWYGGGYHGGAFWLASSSFGQAMESFSAIATESISAPTPGSSGSSGFSGGFSGGGGGGGGGGGW